MLSFVLGKRYKIEILITIVEVICGIKIFMIIMSYDTITIINISNIIISMPQ